MSTKINRAAHGPSWTEVILGALLSLVLGVVLGAALLVLRPVAQKDPAKGETVARGTVFYREGSRETGKARQAAQKRKAFVEGQSVTVGEDELNALVGPGAPAAGAPKTADKGKAPGKGKEPEKTAPAPAASGDLYTLGVPNLRIRDGVLQVGVPVTVNALDLGLKLVVQARGGIVKQGAGFVFDPAELYVGSCPVQRLPFIGSYVREKFIETQAIPEDIKLSWAKLASVAIDGSALKLTMP